MYNPEVSQIESQPNSLEDQWIELGLKAEYPYIKPASDLGLLALDLYEANQIAHAKHNDSLEGPRTVWERACNAEIISVRRIESFRKVMRSMQADLISASAAPISQNLYRRYVRLNCDTAIRCISYRQDMVTEQKRRDISLIKNVAHLLWAENCHFHDLIKASFEMAEQSAPHNLDTA
jgi:hypothetical protein